MTAPVTTGAPGAPPRMGRWARAEYARLSASDGMPLASHDGIRVETDIRVRATDGAELLTDHWFAEGAAGTTVLIRTPYGRTGMPGIARFLAERGHHVVIQSCRGTFGSGGEFRPLHDEAADGQAAMAWLRAQPWATGRVHSYGFSYQGVTQWALCEGPDRPDAMVIGVSARHFDDAIVYPGGGFAMETVLTWSYALAMQERSWPVRMWRLATALPRVARGALAIPPEDAVLVALGERAAFFEDWLAHSAPGDPWWEPLHFADRPGSTPPVTLLAGWQDLFLLGGFADYRALRDRGDAVRLVVGDWTHGSEGTGVVAVRELLRGFEAAAPVSGAPVAEAPVPDAPVRIEVTGGPGWLDLEDWPPRSEPRTWMLRPGGALSEGAADPGESTVTYRYEPADPTPEAGGRTLNPFVFGRRDQRPRERRADVLVFTSDPLDDDLTVIGDPELELTFSSTAPRPDVFVRVCVVDEKGVSLPVSDGFRRLNAEVAPGGHRRVLLELAPMAHRFAAGRRIRVQVSSGSHPMFLRNAGTPDPLHDFTRLVPSEQTVVLGGREPSALRLPVAG
ncbi:MAG: CocE/NonD family hydrolase [Protaetiibacter sp.]